jgi:hypothetical protein
MTNGARADGYAAVLLSLAAALAVVLAIGPQPVGVFQDDGAYVILARSLAQGEGFRFSNIPGEPVATHYPPLYPVLLAALWKLSPAFPANVTLFKFVNAALLGAAAAGAFYFARRTLGLEVWFSVAVTIAGVVTVPVVRMSSMVLSEPLFLALLFPVVMLAGRAVRSDDARPAFWAGLAVGVLALTRTLGALMLPAQLLPLVLRRRWKAAGASIVGAALLMGPWQWWIARHAADVQGPLAGKYGSYLGWLLGGWSQGGVEFGSGVAAVNLRSSAAFLGATFGAAGFPVLLRLGVVVLVLAVTVVGLWRLTRRSSLSAAFLVLYAATVLLWPFAPDRFYWAVWPLLIMTLALGIRESMFASAHTRWPVAAIATGLAILYAGPQFAGTPRLWIVDVQTAVSERSRAIVAWVADSTHPSDVIATEDDALVHLYTGRRAIPAGAFTPQEYVTSQTPAFAAATLAQLVDRYDVRWVLPSTQMGVLASLQLARREPPKLAFRGALVQGAVFERVGIVARQP